MIRRIGISTGEPRPGESPSRPRVVPARPILMGALGITASREGLLVGVRVSPGARRTRVQGPYGERVKVQVNAPPEGGRANEELTSALAGWLDMPADCVRVHSGHTTRDKLVVFSNVSEGDLRRRFERLLGESS